MSQGSHEREHRRDVQCEHCGRFYRNDGIHAHEEHCPYDAVDDRIVPLADNDGGTATPSTSTSDPTPPQDSEGMGSDPRSVTDGGPQAPPEPDVKPVDDQDDELPDRYVDVDEYMDLVKEQSDQIDPDFVEALAARLSDYDVVDVEETTADNIIAYERGEVAR